VSETTRERLFAFWHAFDHPVVTAAVILLVAVLVLSAGVIALLYRLGRIDARQYAEVMTRWRSWLWLSSLMPAHLLSGKQHVLQSKVRLLRDEPDPGALSERLAEQPAQAFELRMVPFETEDAVVTLEEHLHTAGIFFPDLRGHIVVSAHQGSDRLTLTKANSEGMPAFLTPPR
jgi:hypothetical protein